MLALGPAESKTQLPLRTLEASRCVPSQDLWLCSRRCFGGWGRLTITPKSEHILRYFLWLVLQVHVAPESPDTTRPAASSSMAPAKGTAVVGGRGLCAWLGTGVLPVCPQQGGSWCGHQLGCRQLWDSIRQSFLDTLV